jgi:hypothetical protein
MRVLAVAAVLFLPGGAVANDPRDTGGKLDLRSVKAVQDGTLVRLKISTYGPWASKLLQPTAHGRASATGLTVYYDVNGDATADYTGRIVYRGGLYEWITGRGKSLEPVPVMRPTPSSASFTHPVDALFPAGAQSSRKLRLMVVSVYRKRDRAPNTGWLTVSFGQR